MINLVCLLCSMCIQFCAFELPYDVPQYEFIDNLKSFISRDNESPDSFRFFADTNTPYVVFRSQLNNDGSGIIDLLFPLEDFNTSLNSSYYVSNFEYINDNTGVRGDIVFNNFVSASYSIDSNGFITSRIGNFTTSGQINIPFYIPIDNVVANYSYKRVLGCYSLVFRDLTSNEIIFLDPDSLVLPTYGNLGAIDSNGHSANISPLGTLGGVTWSSMSGHSSGGVVGPSPHSSSTHFNTITQNPDVNDSKTDNLLYMLGNKLADITENTSAITSALGGVMYNVMEGASAIFNGISAFNDNVVNFASYLTAVPTSQDISNALEQCENISSLRDLSETINIWEDLGLSQVNSAPTYTFNFNGTMFDSMGNFTLNFNFLDSTKNLWQPLFIALLYFNLLVTILTGLPDLVQGRGET